MSMEFTLNALQRQRVEDHLPLVTGASPQHQDQ